MYKAPRIIAFVVIFFCIAALPLLINHGRSADGAATIIETPEIAALDQQECIESTEFMRAEHMKLLEDWRTEVVRNGRTDYVSSSGQVYEMSLENTCFGCHTNRSEFCISCHEYVAVDPDCWNCHVGEEAVSTV